MKQTFKKKLFKVCKNINPNIIICTTYAAPLISILQNASTHFKAKFVIEAHTIKDKIKKKDDFSNIVLCLCAKIWDWQLQKSISKCDALITLTPNDAQSWYKIKRSYVIPNFITYPTYTTLNESQTVITAGRLEYEKGYDLLIDIWKLVYQKHPEWELKIFGDGSMKEMLTKKINAYQLNNKIHIIPPVNNIYNEYMKSAIYVSSSRFEGFGLSIAEAMSCGIPCIAFDCPYGPRNIIKQNEDGILVNNLDILSLANKLNYLIEHKDIRIKMGENARINIARYASENIMKTWDNLFNEINKD